MHGLTLLLIAFFARVLVFKFSKPEIGKQTRAKNIPSPHKYSNRAELTFKRSRETGSTMKKITTDLHSFVYRRD